MKQPDEFENDFQIEMTIRVNQGDDPKQKVVEFFESNGWKAWGTIVQKGFKSRLYIPYQLDSKKKVDPSDPRHVDFDER